MPGKSRKYVARKNKTHKYKGMKHKSHNNKATKKGGRKTRHPKKRYTRKMRGGTWDGKNCNVSFEDLTDEEAEIYSKLCIPPRPIGPQFANQRPPNYTPPLPPNSFEEDTDSRSLLPPPSSSFQSREPSPPPTYAASFKKPKNKLDEICQIGNCNDAMNAIYRSKYVELMDNLSKIERELNTQFSAGLISNDNCRDFKNALEDYRTQANEVTDNIANKALLARDWITAFDKIQAQAGEIMTKANGNLYENSLPVFKKGVIAKPKTAFKKKSILSRFTMRKKSDFNTLRDLINYIETNYPDKKNERITIANDIITNTGKQIGVDLTKNDVNLYIENLN